MKYLLSLTSTLLEFIRGTITTENIQEGAMFFGAAASHALTPGLIPFEATWANKELPHLYGCDVPVTLDAVDPENRSKVLQFIELVRAADAGNRVRWRDGNGCHRVEQLGLRDPEALVFRHGEWVRTGDLVRKDRHIDARGFAYFEPARIDEDDDSLPASMRQQCVNT
jgi:hypothetical protein